MIWIKCANEVLRNNKVNAYVFAAAIRDLLEKGRGKNRNIVIVGPANCGKTFLLNPLNQLFQTFTNPATTSYAWVGSENAEVIFLNDFRWSPEILAWKDMLLLLEGQTLHLLAPKTHFAKDIVFDRDTPIFATSKGQIVFVGKGGCFDEKETEMMSARWKLFSFFYQIPESSQKESPSCKRCFSELVMLGSNI
jgi:energy-coupling factor transporter ATP-binding protein EcfA2